MPLKHFARDFVLFESSGFALYMVYCYRYNSSQKETDFTKVESVAVTVVDKSRHLTSRRRLFAYQLFVKWSFCERVDSAQEII